MRVLLLNLSILLSTLGCYQDKGPTILVVYDGENGPGFNFEVGEGDWFFIDGKWIDGANVVTPADRHSVQILEEYLGPIKVAHHKNMK